MPSDLSNHHRDTLEKIFRHPVSGNIDWRRVVSLLGAVGTTVEEHDGNVKVTLGAETEVFHPPSGKAIDAQTVVDLRRMLTQARVSPGEVSGRED